MFKWVGLNVNEHIIIELVYYCNYINLKLRNNMKVQSNTIENILNAL